MEQKKSLVYHQETLDFIHEQPTVSEQAIEILNQLEQKRGCTLPASVREWYSLKRSAVMLSKHSDGQAIDVEHLGAVNHYWSEGRYHEIDLFPKGLLPFLVENHGSCTWAIHWNGWADPPVFVSVDNMTPSAVWQPCADMFSEFLYSCVWDHQIISSDEKVFGWTPQLTSVERAFLQETFQEGPRIYHFPGRVNLRFFSGSQHILIQEGSHQTSWYFLAASDEELKQLIEKVQRFETLKQNLHLERNGLTEWEDMFPDDSRWSEE